MKVASDFSKDQVQFSNTIQSRKNKHLRYVYLSAKNDKNDVSSVTIESPKVSVGQHYASNRSDISVLEVNLEQQPYKDPASNLSELIQNIYKYISDRFKKEIHDGYTAHLNPDIWKLKVIHKGSRQTMFFSEISKKELDSSDLESIQPPTLSSKLIRMIAELDGVIIDDDSKSIRPVWSTDQVLLYAEEPINPFGKRYCFLDDDDNYMSLEDE